MSETGEVKENGRGDNSNMEILTDIGDVESRICCSLGSLGSRPHNEGECAECLLVRAFGIHTCGRDSKGAELNRS